MDIAADAASTGSDSAVVHTRTCQEEFGAGWVLTGGGFDMGQSPSGSVPQGVQIEDSQPTGSGVLTNGGWYAVAREKPAQHQAWYLRVWGICAHIAAP